MTYWPIVDLHTCVQGEGKYAGIPHLLIRLTGCNLNCQFKQSICDTAYASWKPEKGKYIKNDIEKIIRKNPQIHHSFITGGEPTIYPEILKELFTILKKNNHFISLETNGTQVIEEKFDFVTVSPKMSNSVPVPGTVARGDRFKRTVTEKDKNNHDINRLRIDNLKDITNRFDFQFKFVISCPEDIVEASELVQNVGIPGDKVYLMPEGIHNEQLQLRRPWLIDECIRLGYNYTDRLHIIAFGNKREA